MGNHRIAVIGLACRYPDADTPLTLWRNALAQRRAFRRIPAERLRLEDYRSTENPADSIYSREAAVLTDYEFDRVAFRVGGRSYRAADLAHWLALEVASEALADAGFEHADGLPRDDVGVLVGNTLTGEFSRAQLLRLRWPYVRRQATAALAEEGMEDSHIETFVRRFETLYKQPFPENTEESLAGGLANTIAGRIANHFDLHGGGFTVDGACASSLLAVAQSCSALVAGDLEVALAGGVDLSLDPFELVGFARTGALAKDDMRIFDQRPSGFIPGEGCGFAVLMREDDALARGCRIYAVIRGWGISSDGSGGLTRPEVEGQVLAFERAYRRAGYGIDSVQLFEGHGTGTALGDRVELQTLNKARSAAPPCSRQAALGSIKANIGHTKAAAGLAGLIKAVHALHHQILPPTTGCEQPHDELTDPASSLRVLRRAELWPVSEPLRAAVSAMGFGGINCHLTLESRSETRRRSFSAAEKLLTAIPQGVEVLLFEAADIDQMRRRLQPMAELAQQICRSELADLAAELARQVDPEPRPSSWRVAIVASSPRQLNERLLLLQCWLDEPWDPACRQRLQARQGIFVGQVGERPRIGLLFPGQGSPSHLDGGVWKERFTAVEKLYRQAALPTSGDAAETAIAQPAIVTAELAGVRLLDMLGVEAVAAVGHSLGELAALCWAGAWDEATVQGLAAARGRAMSELEDSTGAMASLGAGAAEVAELIGRWPSEDLCIASFNTPTQTVVAGAGTVVDEVVVAAQELGWNATRLAVSHAFHSPRVAAAEPRLGAALAAAGVGHLQQAVASTISGGWLQPDQDLVALLRRQVTAPVRFVEALEALAADVDVLVEVGPGRALSGLAAGTSDLPVVTLDVGAEDFTGLVETVALLFAMGAQFDPSLLFVDRPIRRFSLDCRPRFLANPCESAPWSELAAADPSAADDQAQSQVAVAEGSAAAGEDAASEDPALWVRQLLSRRAELPIETLSDDLRLLGDLHLSSIVVSEVVTEAARHLGAAPPLAPAEYANATVGELTTALGELAAAAVEPSADQGVPAGLDSWVRSFVVEPFEIDASSPAGTLPATVEWQFHGEIDDPLHSSLAAALAAVSQAADADREAPPIAGTVLLLSDQNEPLDALLAATQAAVEQRSGFFLLVGPRAHHNAAAAFVRTLHLEAPEVAVTVVSLPLGELPDLATWCARIAAVALATRRFRELRFDLDGGCREPRLVPLPATAEIAVPALAVGDLVVVSGGGKGIGAECALALAQRYGVVLALLGRSSAASDSELTANLERFAAHGVSCQYLQVDVTDPTAVTSAMTGLTGELGPIRAILHSAGANQPRLIADLDRRSIDRCLAAKVEGLAHLLAAVDRQQLRLVVGFGSIIGRMGLQGEAHYALANHRLRRAIELIAEQYPACRALCLEWSVWSGVGMGARLAQLDVLAHQGITPIPPQAGVAELLSLLDRPSPVAVVVSGRFGSLPTLRCESPELPLQRFLETPRVHVPGVELVVDVEVSLATDPYLADHIYGSERLFPAVLGLEAMSQVGLALANRPTADGLRLASIHFESPVTVPENQTVTLRLVALQHPDGTVGVALRSSRSSYQVDHFSTVLVFDERPDQSVVPAPQEGRLALEPEDLYGSVLFQSGRFRRLLGYHWLSATECRAEVESDPAAGWFAPLLPADLLLGDPGARDASLHAVQACIPHATVLPVAVESLQFGPAVMEAGRRQVSAIERQRNGRTLIYDLEVRNERGQLVERWKRLELRAMDEPGRRPPWVPALYGPYLERRLADLLPAARLRVALKDSAGSDPRRLGRQAIEEAMGDPVTVLHRPDGKPETLLASDLLAVEPVAGNGRRNGSNHCQVPSTSVSYLSEWVLALVGRGELGCDIEQVQSRSAATWRDLLGERQKLLPVLAQHSTEDPDVLATRVWTVLEGLKKAGCSPLAPLVFAQATDDGWILFSSGRYRAATVVLPLATAGEQVAVAVVSELAAGEIAAGEFNPTGPQQAASEPVGEELWEH